MISTPALDRWMSGFLVCAAILGCQKKEEPREITFWTAEVEQDRLEVQQNLAERFAAKYPGIRVRVVPVDENVLPEKLASAKAADALPDVVELGLTQIVQYAHQGVLDTQAATEVVSRIGEEAFYRGPLKLCGNPSGTGYAAVPIDGFVQGIWYRKDWFSEKDLNPPATWDDLIAAARAFQNPAEAVFGIVVGTHPQQMYTQQVFEQVALSNGARLFDPSGKFTGQSPAMEEAVAYYAQLAAAGPPGHNYWREARQYYLTGRAAMIYYSPYIIDDIAGLVAEHQPTVPDLAKKTGFSPTLTGPGGESASYGEVYALGIPSGADPAAGDWVEFLLDEGYQDWLSMAPGGKIPVRRAAVERWKDHPYFGHYDPGLADILASGMDDLARWGFFGDAAVPAIGNVTATKLVPEMLGRVLEGKASPQEALAWLKERAEAVR